MHVFSLLFAFESTCSISQPFSLICYVFSAVHPDLDHYVFLRVNENVEGVLVEEETAEARSVGQKMPEWVWLHI